VRRARSTHPLGPALNSNWLSGPRADPQGSARRLRTRSIAHREARTIVTCTKSAPPTHSSPPACRGRSGPRPRGLWPSSAWMPLRASRPKCRQPRARKTRKAVHHLTMFFEDRGRQPLNCLPRTRGKEGWRHLGRDEVPTSWGALLLYFKDFSRSRGYRRCTPVCTPGHTAFSLYRTRVRYRVSRRVYDRCSGAGPPHFLASQSREMRWGVLSVTGYNFPSAHLFAQST
jgi:hypothetical protein